MEFARQRTHLLMRDVERVVRARAAAVFFQNFRPPPKKRLVGRKETAKTTKVPKPSTQHLSHMEMQP